MTIVWHRQHSYVMLYHLSKISANVFGFAFVSIAPVLVVHVSYIFVFIIRGVLLICVIISIVGF